MAGQQILRALDAIGPEQHHFILLAVLCRWQAHEPEASDDALEARWFGLGAVHDLAGSASRDVFDIAAAALETRR